MKCSVGKEKVAAEGLMQPVLLPMWSNPANIKLDKIILATTIIFNQFSFPKKEVSSTPGPTPRQVSIWASAHWAAQRAPIAMHCR